MQHSRKSPLVYSTDDEPGIARIASKGVVSYRGPAGREIGSSRTLERIVALAIPPAWTGVWICVNPLGHIQATGKDVRGRKQYRYHSQWIAERDSNKFDALHDFGLVLPRIRRKVNRDLALPRLTKIRVLAAIVQLMDRVFIRVGGERYRRENGSFGATTLRTGHVNVEGSEIKLDFRGKSGKRHQLELRDKRVASVVRKCLDLPGETLFQYREDGEVRSICASDVNEYLKQISGSTVTSKDFRTWGGTACAAQYLAGVDLQAPTAVKRAHIRQAVKAAARVLGNTPAVCRRSYIHPVVLASYEEGRAADPMRIAGLRVSERVVLSLLKRQRRPTTAESRAPGTRTAQPVAQMA